MDDPEPGCPETAREAAELLDERLRVADERVRLLTEWIETGELP